MNSTVNVPTALKKGFSVKPEADILIDQEVFKNEQIIYLCKIRLLHAPL